MPASQPSTALPLPAGADPRHIQMYYELFQAGLLVPPTQPVGENPEEQTEVSLEKVTTERADKEGAQGGEMEIDEVNESQDVGDSAQVEKKAPARATKPGPKPKPKSKSKPKPKPVTKKKAEDEDEKSQSEGSTGQAVEKTPAPVTKAKAKAKAPVKKTAALESKDEVKKEKPEPVNQRVTRQGKRNIDELESVSVDQSVDSSNFTCQNCRKKGIECKPPPDNGTTCVACKAAKSKCVSEDGSDNPWKRLKAARLQKPEASARAPSASTETSQPKRMRMDRVSPPPLIYGNLIARPMERIAHSLETLASQGAGVSLICHSLDNLTSAFRDGISDIVHAIAARDEGSNFTRSEKGKGIDTKPADEQSMQEIPKKADEVDLRESAAGEGGSAAGAGEEPHHGDNDMEDGTGS